MTIGERIKEVRKYYKCSQRNFAVRLNLSQAHISNIEANKDNPSDKIIKQICAVYKINREWLKSGEGEMLIPKCSTHKEALNTLPVFTRRLVFLFEESGANETQLVDFICKQTGKQLDYFDVVKWCEGANVDLELIPVIAEFFGVSIEFMFNDFRKNIMND